MSCSNLITLFHQSIKEFINNLGPKLTITRTSPKYRVWNDAGSGARADGSFWTVHQSVAGFKLIGDTACGQPNRNNDPCETTIMVKDTGNNLVKKPIGSNLIWTDKGSGAHKDVRIYQLQPPIGYKCLGMVAVGSGSPDLDRYRCVKQEFVEQVNLERRIWDDRGSGADDDFASYSIEDTLTTINMGVFYGAQGHDFDKTIQSTVVYAILVEKIIDDVLDNVVDRLPPIIPEPNTGKF